MTKRIKATEEGASLFNAIAIGLGFEILKNRVPKDSEGYQLLLDAFANQHPQFKPKNWETLVHWLSYYNNSKDIELILAPVLFQLNKRFQQEFETKILDELTQLVWNNKSSIDKEEPWEQLSITEGSVALFPQINNLSMNYKIDLLKKLKGIFARYTDGLSRDELRLFLAKNAKATEIIESLKIAISSNPNASQRTKNFLEVLSINLLEESSSPSFADGVKIYLSREMEHWEVSFDDEVDKVLNTNPQILNMSIYQSGSISAPQVPAPTAEQLGQSRVLITDRDVDNPGQGNCAFYSFAIGLIDIIQEEKVYGCKTKFEQWVTQDKNLADEYDAICAFNYKQPDNLLLDRLQRSLRNIGYNYKVAELKLACAKSTAADVIKGLDKKSDEYKEVMILIAAEITTIPYKKALLRKYRHITANSTYIDFTALYYGHRQDLGHGASTFSDSVTIKNAIDDLDKSKIEENYEDLVLVPLFLKLLYGDKQALKTITQETVPDAASPILSGMNNVAEESYWGTHLDLNYLATLFKVNLHTLENGRNLRQESRGDLGCQHTITVNNHGDYHWTTQLTMAVELPKILLSVSEDEKRKKEKGRVTGVLGTSVTKDSSPLIPTIVPVVTGLQKDDAVTTDDEHHGKVRFKFTKSQLELQERRDLEAQREHDLKLLDQTNDSEKAVISSPLDESDDNKKLAHLRSAVSNATIAYTGYSNSIWFSLFHRHGNSGRVRAETFNTRFLEIKNYSDAKKELITFLHNNNDNGNTHPHSFRTMLLHEMHGKKSESTLQYISAHFDDLLGELSSAFKVRIPSAVAPSI